MIVEETSYLEQINKVIPEEYIQDEEVESIPDGFITLTVEKDIANDLPLGIQNHYEAFQDDNTREDY